MTAQTAQSMTGTLTLTVEERENLLDLLRTALGETRVEAHRTHHTPSFRDRVLHHEALIRGLIEKLGATC